MNIWKMVYLNCGKMIVEGEGCKWIYERSCIWTDIHLLRVYYELSKWPAPRWLDTSVGRTLHRYRRGHGFESSSGLNFFRLKFHNCLSYVYNCDDQFNYLEMYFVTHFFPHGSVKRWKNVSQTHKRWPARLAGFGSKRYLAFDIFSSRLCEWRIRDWNRFESTPCQSPLLRARNPASYAGYTTV